MNQELIQKLMKQESKKVVGDLKNLVGVERKATGDILHYFYVVQRRRIFAEFGYPNIYKFSMGELHYTEAETQRRVTSSRLLGEIPELEEKLNVGKLSLTTVSMAHTLFNREEKAKNTFSLEKKISVLESFENKSVKECEKEIFKVATVTPIPKEKVRQLSSDQAQITLNVSHEFLDEVEKLKNIYSHKHPGITTSELLGILVKEAAMKHDPAREPRRAQKSKLAQNPRKLQETEFQRSVSVSKQPKPAAPNKHYIKASLKRAVWQKYQSRCSFVTTDGKRCDSKHSLEIDHIEPKALGGETCIENLRLLCKAHNQLHAIETFGFKKMDPFINAP